MGMGNGEWGVGNRGIRSAMASVSEFFHLVLPWFYLLKFLNNTISESHKKLFDNKKLL